jgi:catalase
MSDDKKKPTLTTRQGHPVVDNQNVRTVGDRGLMTLENYHFMEKIMHFDRERIPERVVHARGAGAHGVFEAYGQVGDEPIGKYTRAKLLQQKGKKTPTFVRFSVVTHGGHAPETLRDVRGFATKFYTEDGNWDLLCNNLKVFFIRDPMQFPDMVHAFKPDPVTNRQDACRIFDFISHHPEAMHILTWLFSPWGIPANYREMEGYGVNTYKWVNAEGVGTLIRYHWVPKQGVRNLTQAQAEEIQSKNFNHATQDLYDAIERGDYPVWELCVQMMEDDFHEELDFDPLDDTVHWPEDTFPLKPVGQITLNKNPINYFAEVEQVAFSAGVFVDGLDFSDDKILQGRAFPYADAQRYRVGTNYLHLPINAPKKPAITNQRDGQMAYHVDGVEEGVNPHVNFEPSAMGGVQEAVQEGKLHMPHYDADLVRQKIARINDFKQAGECYRAFKDWEREELIKNLTGTLKTCPKDIQERMISYFTQADADYGRAVAEGIQ